MTDSVRRVVQITDTHLFADPARALKGIATDAALRAVLAAARDDLAAADLVLLTGDLAHDERDETYQRLRALVAEYVPVDVPLRAIPGNHDDPALIAARFGAATVADLGDWVCVPLDSHLPGQVEGRLSVVELARLDDALRQACGRSVLIAVHHHPVDVGSLWMDGIALTNHEDLFAIIRNHGNVRAIINGHIHQEFEGERDGVRVFGTPSTNVQFRARSDQPLFAELEPGYRRLRLYPDGRIETEVVRVGGVVRNLDLDGGY